MIVMPNQSARNCSRRSLNSSAQGAVALRVFPRQDTASLSGEAWLEFLNTTRGSLSGTPEFPSAFANAAYLADIPDLDSETLFQATEAWILNHRAPA